MNKYVLRTLLVLAVVLVIGGSGALKFVTGLDPNAFVDDDIIIDTSNRGGEDDDGIKYEDDTGTIKSNIFQAEVAEFSGVSRDSDHACPAYSYHYHYTFANGIVVKNMSTNSFTFRFTSDKNIKAKMIMHIASDKTWKPAKLDATFMIDINGLSVDTSEITIPGSDETNQIEGSIYFNMVDVEVPINIKQGDNELVFYTQGAPNNFDYIDIKTSATIENKTEESYFAPLNEFLSISKMPTATDKGIVTFTCPKEGCGRISNYEYLPPLGNANYESVTTGEEVTYYITIAGNKYEVGKLSKSEANHEYTLTVVDGTLTGGTTSGKFTFGQTVDLLSTLQVPTDKTLKGWYNVETKEIISENPTSIIMPDGDIKIAPYYDGKYANFVDGGPDSGLGKIRLAYSLSNLSGSTQKFFQGSSTAGLSAKNAIVENEPGVVMTKDQEVVEGTYAIPMTSYNISVLKRTFTYTIHNYGESTVKINVFMVNASANAATLASDAKLLTIAPGETKSCEYTVENYSNINVLPVFQFPETVTGLNIGAFAYCTWIAEHTCLDQCAFCGKCTVANCEELVCAEKCEKIIPTQSVKLINGKDFFKSSDWESYPSGSTASKARGEDTLYGCTGGLLFTKDTASRFDLFHVAENSSGGYVHLADISTNITSGAVADAIYNQERSYKMELAATGEFDLTLFGVKNSEATRSNQSCLYLNFSTDGKVTYYHTNSTSNTSKYTSKGELSGASSFKMDGSKNTVEFIINRVNSARLELEVVINGETLILSGTSSSSYISFENNKFISDGILSNQGYGQRFGVIPFNETAVNISSLTLA